MYNCRSIATIFIINSVIEKDLKLAGYFVIITSEKMTAADALRLYKGRDASEKLFRGDKSYLGNKSYRNYHTESVDAKIFVEFIALIIRSRMHVLLSDENKRLDNKKELHERTCYDTTAGET